MVAKTSWAMSKASRLVRRDLWSQITASDQLTILQKERKVLQSLELQQLFSQNRHLVHRALQTQARSEESLQVNMMRLSPRRRASKSCPYLPTKKQHTKRNSSRKRSLWCKKDNQTKSKKFSLFWNQMIKRPRPRPRGVKTLASLI